MIVTFTVLTFGLSSRAFCRSFKAFAMFSMFFTSFVLSEYIIPHFYVVVNAFFKKISKNLKISYFLHLEKGAFFMGESGAGAAIAV